MKIRVSGLAAGGMLFAVLACVSTTPAAEPDALLERELPSLVELYKHFHANPELSYFEQETSRRVARELEEAGFEVTWPAGDYPHNDRPCYGVVGVMRNGEGPTVLVRGDMDALPIGEKTGLEWASEVTMEDVDGTVKPVMHACGHDIHSTCLVGTARLLAGMRDSWSGTLVAVGQTAEERGGGARALIHGGLYEKWPAPDYALALHVDPTIEAGRVGYRAGWAMANVDMVDLLIRGVGAHGARPHQGKDPVVLAAQVINALQTIVSREINPVETGVVTVGSIHGGSKHNIIPDEVLLQLTVRSYKDEVRERILSSIERIAVNTARAAGVPENRLPVMSGGDEYTPALYNDPALVERTTAAMRDALGADNLVEIMPTTGGEDFSEYGRTENDVPIFMFRLGSAAPGSDPSTRPGLHSPLYCAEHESAIRTGVRAMSAAVLELMKN